MVGYQYRFLHNIEPTESTSVVCLAALLDVNNLAEFLRLQSWIDARLLSSEAQQSAMMAVIVATCEYQSRQALREYCKIDSYQEKCISILLDCGSG